MSEEILPERVEYLIELVARRIVDLELEDFAEVILEGTKPFGPFIGETGFLMTYPSMVAFFGQGGHDFANMMGFNYTENADRILERVKELTKEREEARRRERELRGESEGSWLSRLKSFLS
ncbi:MAG: hypothetical protein JSW01_03910 [Candidatus Bathyarchaeota archaeon]|nr:MAG: hypothetical protein JSW01_03910 [Candidatus Bathyarchaeota archaeon]